MADLRVNDFDPALLKQLKVAAVDAEVTLKQFVTSALRAAMRNQTQPKKG